MTLLSSSTTLPPAPDPLSDAFPWLKSLPLAPTYYPTIAEFEDPIGYIFKIEKEASQFGICKIVPPLPPPPKKTAIAYLNRSLLGGEDRGVPKFTTREQQIGFCPRRTCPVKRPVWQSGEEYTVQEFEAKAKGFEKHYLKKWAKGKEVSALEIETLFWKANADKPFRVEYANDMPGSAFVPMDKKKKGSGGAGNVGDSSWNMRGVSRAKGSLLKFMKEEIPGVTSPMLYIAMMFSWFAWHVEDHDLHSLNYLHMGAGKTWYGVPREAAVAFEEVVRVHGYGEEVNALGTFSALGEKTTVISPEVFITAGVPCCRLVQCAGEFVVTFPRAYHSGFSHGFNCGEAANIATPEWLRVAKDAAIRRATINHPPMVSHFQLLYDLALSLCTRISVGVTATPRSSRLKDKKKNEGETLVKELFVQNIIRNNGLLYNLAKGSSVVLLPQGSTESSVCSNIHFGSQLRGNPRLSLRMGSRSEAIGWSNVSVPDDGELDRIHESVKAQNHCTVKKEVASHCGNRSGDDNVFATASHTQPSNATRGRVIQGDRISNQRLFSCVTCGILTFDCVAIIQPKALAARHLMSADCGSINDLIIGSGSLTNGVTVACLDEIIPERNSCAGFGRTVRDSLYSVPVKPDKFQIPCVEQNYEMILNSRSRKDNSALHLLAMTYGNSSDDEDNQKEPDHADSADDAMLRKSAEEVKSRDDSAGPSSSRPGFHLDLPEHVCQSQSRINHKVEIPTRADKIVRDTFDDNSHQSPETVSVRNGNLVHINVSISERMFRSKETSLTSDCSLVVNDAGNMRTCKSIFPGKETNTFPAEIYDEDSSRIHVFCLEHALEVEQQLSQIGGVHMILLCHPEYPQVEAEAQNMAREMGIKYSWNDLSFRDSDKKDEDHIQLALDSQEAIAGNGDWAVKLGINLFYSANLSRSSLYCRQMPYNSVMYNAFGCNSPVTSPTRSDVYCRRSGRKKKVVAGKWCGKVWMSNQVHPYLVQRVPEDEDEKDDPKSHAQTMLDEKPERKLEKRQNSRENTVTRKSGKRKIIVEEDTDYTSLDDHDHKRQRSITRSLPIRSVERGDTNSADSPESSQPHRTLKGKQLTAFSEDLVEDSLQQLWRKSKRKKSNFRGREEAISDDFVDDFPYGRHRNNTRSKLLKSVGSDDANSDDSFTLYPENSRGKHAKFIGRDNLSYDSIEYDSSHSMTPRGKHSICITGEDTDSDDSPTGSSRPTNKNPRGRRAKYIEKRDALPDDSLENNSPLQCKQNVRKQANRVGNLDVVSDCSYEDNSDQPYRKAIRKKQRKLGNLREQKQNTSQQNKHRSARRKQETASRIRHETSVQTKQKSARVEELESEPSTRLRTRSSKKLKNQVSKLPVKKLASQKSGKAAIKPSVGPEKDEENEYPCDIEGCAMGFGSKRELMLHKKNICPVKGCGKTFFSHKYLVQHRKVHMDDRPLKCPWKGCSMTFKWPWARTEHIRVHTGARPYACNEPGCGQTFRFVSDFSRHKRKTGHSAKKNSK